MNTPRLSNAQAHALQTITDAGPSGVVAPSTWVAAKSLARKGLVIATPIASMRAQDYFAKYQPEGSIVDGAGRPGNEPTHRDLYTPRGACRMITATRYVVAPGVHHVTTATVSAW